MQFSIVITSHNQRIFIQAAVDSALATPEESKEVIVVDDASTDGSQELLHGYGDAIRLLRLEKNQGPCVARNRGASLARGDYLVFLDGDDAFPPWALSVYARVIDSRHPKMILGRIFRFREQLPQIMPGDDPRMIRVVEYQDYMHKDRPFHNSASALVVERLAFQSVGGWPEEVFPMEDQELAFRLGDTGRTVQILSPATVLYRSHASNTVNHVPPFLSSLRQMLERERHALYPGGERRRFERYSLLGGLVFFWTRRAIGSGMLREAVSLLASGWPLVVVASTRRAHAIMRGRRSCETLVV